MYLALKSLLVCEWSANNHRGGNVSLACVLKMVKGPHFAHIVELSMGRLQAAGE